MSKMSSHTLYLILTAKLWGVIMRNLKENGCVVTASHCIFSNYISIVYHLGWGIILWMRPANEIQRYILTSPLTGWSYTQNHLPWLSMLCIWLRGVSSALTLLSRSLFSAACWGWLKRSLRRRGGCVPGRMTSWRLVVCSVAPWIKRLKIWRQNRWFSAWLQEAQCVSNGVTAGLH